MHKIPKSIVICVFLYLVFSCDSRTHVDNYRIAFGSCAHQDSEFQMWANIEASNPDLFVLLGDNIYGDTDDPEILKEKYSKQKSRIDYQSLISKVQTIGTWDDHDFGRNDAGKEYPIKEESKDLMMEFLDIGDDNPIRTREGVYQDYKFNAGNHEVSVILLDTRYFRDSLAIDTTGNGPYGQNVTGDILGENQWQWLEKVLRNSTSDINIIGSSIQVLSAEHGWEKWNNFPSARKRLFDLLEEVKPKNVIFISGDRHIAEFSKLNLDRLDYPVYDFTSSGMTSTWGKARAEPNKHRVKEMMVSLNYGLINLRFTDDQINVSFEVMNENNELVDSLGFTF